MKITTYDLLIRKIQKGGYDADEMMVMLDTFYVVGRITKSQYEELAGLVRNDSK